MSSPSNNIFNLVPLPLINGDFSLDLSSSPPTGWSVLGTLGFFYDTVNPYITGGVSFVAASPQFTSDGIQSSPVKVTPGDMIYVSAAGRRGAGSVPVAAIADNADLKIQFLDVTGTKNTGPAIDLNFPSPFWSFQAQSAVVPDGTDHIVVQFLVTNISSPLLASAEISNIVLGKLPALNYYRSLLTSQYQNSPKLKLWLAALSKPFIDASLCLASMYQAFDLNLAQGAQLDILGEILGVSRTLPFTPSGGAGILNITADVGTGAGYTIGTDVVTVVQGAASGGTAKIIGSRTVHFIQTLLLQLLTPGINYANASGLAVTGGTGTGLKVDITVSSVSAVLDDPTYRLLLKAKVAFNQWNGQIDTLYPIWAGLFPGGRIIVTDNRNMTATISLTGNFTPLMQQIIQAGLIIPRPQGVQYNYSFAAGAIFGFDLNNLTIAGFDVGVWE